MAAIPDPATGGPEDRLPEAAFVEEDDPALADPDAGPDATVVHFHFPVEIELRSAPEAADPQAAAQLALRLLTEGLHGL
jgi:hypothetical protein